MPSLVSGKCPGRGAAERLHRRAGTYLAFRKMGPGSAAHRKSAAPHPGHDRKMHAAQPLLLRRLLAVGVALGCAGQNLLGDQA
jgi:hypothetical protein